MTVADINAYGLVIGGSLVIILSYFANLLAKRTNIPSVLVLIGMGIALREGLNAMGLTSIPFESLVLELLGTIGLIFIVLEAALELDLTRDKMPLIVKSATMALLALLEVLRPSRRSSTFPWTSPHSRLGLRFPCPS